jgi:hypothetical protein
MSNNEVLLNIYRMKDKQGCLVFKSTGKPYKIFNITEVLPFAGWMKQLSMAIDTGAGQDCKHHLFNADGLEHQLICKFVQEVVALELWVLERLKFSWKGTAKDFKAAVDRMISKLPRFF